MSKGLRIINIDESVFRSTDARKKGWLLKGKHNQETKVFRIDHLNIIAAISNRNEVFFTINNGKTNSHTFSFFLLKLCEQLNS